MKMNAVDALFTASGRLAQMQRETDITIPLKALKAARKAYMKCPDLAWHDAVDAACLAMLKAWPSKTIHNDHLHWPEYPHIILPLPQKEPRDAE